MCNQRAGAKNGEENCNAEGEMPSRVGQCLHKVGPLQRGDTAPTILTDYGKIKNKTYDDNYSLNTIQVYR
jgi:hypothetical protein